MKGEFPSGRTRSGDIEVYDMARFFTVMGVHVDGTPDVIRERSTSEALDRLARPRLAALLVSLRFLFRKPFLLASLRRRATPVVRLASLGSPSPGPGWPLSPFEPTRRSVARSGSDGG